MINPDLMAIDQDFIERMFGQNPALYRRVLSDFRSILPQQIDQLETCVGDNAELAKCVHRLAGQMANLGFIAMAELARDTEMLLKAKSDHAIERYGLLREALTRINELPEVVGD